MARVFQQILSLTPLEVCALTVLVEELSTTGYDVLPNMIWQPLLAACVLLLASAEWHVPQQLFLRSFICSTISCLCCYVLQPTCPLIAAVAFFAPTFGKQGRLPFQPSGAAKPAPSAKATSFASPEDRGAAKPASFAPSCAEGSDWYFAGEWAPLDKLGRGALGFGLVVRWPRGRNAEHRKRSCSDRVRRVASAERCEKHWKRCCLGAAIVVRDGRGV